MFLTLVEAFVLALSLCADSFAVSTCSGVTLGSFCWKKVLPVAFVFGLVQASFLLFGWLLGDLFVGKIERIADVIGFLLLLYVGGSMILEAVKGKDETIDLKGMKNIIVGAVATSIDALAVGVGLSMAEISSSKMMINSFAVFIVTMLVIFLGTFGGQKIGQKYGRTAEFIGGIVLIFIGLNILFDFI